MSGRPEGRPSGARQRLLLHVERFARVHWRLVFLLAILAVAASAWLGSKLRLDSDILHLVPQGNPQVDTFRQALSDFGSIDYLMVLVESDGTAGADVLEDFSDLFAEKLVVHEELVERVEYRFQPDEQFLKLFYENALLFLPPDKMPELAERLTDDAIRQRLRETKLSLSSPTTSLTEAP